MKDIRSRSLWIAALAGCALLAAVGFSPQLAAKEMVPYKGAGWGFPLVLDIVWPTTEDPQGKATGTLMEIGQATHFGQYECLMEVDGYFVMEGEVLVLVWTGTFVQVAADGSSVTGYISSGREPLNVGPPTPFTMTLTIDGGTGRFEGATGSWDMLALSTGDYTCTTEGMISSIGSVRSRK